jgi:hypothetical protein
MNLCSHRTGVCKVFSPLALVQFQRYLSGLIVAKNKTVDGINRIEGVAPPLGPPGSGGSVSEQVDDRPPLTAAVGGGVPGP